MNHWTLLLLCVTITLATPRSITTGSTGSIDADQVLANQDQTAEIKRSKRNYFSDAFNTILRPADNFVAESIIVCKNFGEIKRSDEYFQTVRKTIKSVGK